MAPFQASVHHMLDAFRVELLDTQKVLQKQTEDTPDLITIRLQEDREEKQRLKATKPMNQSVAQRFATFEA